MFLLFLHRHRSLVGVGFEDVSELEALKLPFRHFLVDFGLLSLYLLGNNTPLLH